MDVWRITVAALRRWYVLLPLLALTFLAVVATGRGMQPEYDATGTAMFVPGRSIPTTPNPYGGVTDANAAVAIVLNGPDSRQQIAERDLSPNYQVSPQSRSTIMTFSVRASSGDIATQTGAAVFELARKELRDRQAAAGIPSGERYGIDVLDPPSVSAAVTDGKRRNMAVVGVLGAGISLVIAVFFDDIVGLVRRRNQRGKRAKAEGTPSENDGGATSVPAADTTDAGASADGPPGRALENRSNDVAARERAASDRR